jgi:hypothetical protein
MNACGLLLCRYLLVSFSGHILHAPIGLLTHRGLAVRNE